MYDAAQVKEEIMENELKVLSDAHKTMQNKCHEEEIRLKDEIARQKLKNKKEIEDIKENLSKYKKLVEVEMKCLK